MDKRVSTLKSLTPKNKGTKVPLRPLLHTTEDFNPTAVEQDK
jgi:hypothetical protein